ncbi:glycosyltransferase 87 family protein [Knoellia sp. CPCC 206453]|uniref:glycosyltransferase 87 family protein n=1 Tax=Knoellia pratensis TaxID=3404796 RepID=UPI003614E98E
MRRILVGTVAMAACSAGHALSGDLDTDRVRLAVVMVAWWVVAVATIRWVLGSRGGGAGDSLLTGPVRRTALLVFVVALVVQLPGLLTSPRSSTDAYRYVWDGRVQLSGTSPYRYAPLDDRLADLRDPILFPGLASSDHSGYVTQPLPTDRSGVRARAKNDPRTVINRPQVPTIYPPVAQVWFTAVASVTPWSWGTRGLQAGSALLAAGVAGALAALLRRRGSDPGRALWWAWCPAVVAEAGNGAHVDVLAAAFVVAALTVVSPAVGGAGRGRAAAVLAGVMTGLAALVKLYPAVMLSSLFSLRHNASRAQAAVAVTVLTVLLAYLPHWLAAGHLVLGYLPAYVVEESGANRSGIVQLLVPDAAVTPVTILLLAIVAGAVAWSRVGDPATGATLVLGSLLLLTTPSYPWYALPMLACAVLAGRLEWLAVAFAAVLAYASASVPPVPTIAYAASAAFVLVVAFRRSRLTGGLVGRSHSSRIAGGPSARGTVETGFSCG